MFRYRLAGEDVDTFIIDPVSGEITASYSLDREERETYR